MFARDINYLAATQIKRRCEMYLKCLRCQLNLCSTTLFQDYNSMTRRQNVSTMHLSFCYTHIRSYSISRTLTKGNAFFSCVQICEI